MKNAKKFLVTGALAAMMALGVAAPAITASADATDTAIWKLTEPDDDSLHLLYYDEIYTKVRIFGGWTECSIITEATSLDTTGYTVGGTTYSGYTPVDLDDCGGSECTLRLYYKIDGKGTPDTTDDTVEINVVSTKSKIGFDSINSNHMFGFYQGTEIKGLDKFDTSNLKSLDCMFISCPNLTKVDLSSFDTAKVTNVGYMFENCTSLTEIKLSDKFVLTTDVTRYGDTFNNTAFKSNKYSPIKIYGANPDAQKFIEDHQSDMKYKTIDAEGNIDDVNGTSQIVFTTEEDGKSCWGDLWKLIKKVVKVAVTAFALIFPWLKIW